MSNNLPIIQIDTRERTPWTFAQAFKGGKIAGTVSEYVTAGDYALRAYPKLVVIERKKNVSELYNNFVPQDKRDRFDREMQRMQEYKHKYIVVEQEWKELYNERNFRYASKNQSYAGVVVLSNLIRIMGQFGVHVIFAGDNAEHTATTILVRHYWEEFERLGANGQNS